MDIWFKLNIIGVVMSIIIGLIVLYTFIVYTDIPIIVRWRTLYIETALSTMDKQWLATKLLPKSIIDKVVMNREACLIKINKETEQYKEVKVMEIIKDRNNRLLNADEKELFYNKYWEINRYTLERCIESNPSILKDGYNNLYINNYKIMDIDNGIKTIFNEKVVVIDSKNGIVIVEVKTEYGVGKLAIVKDPKQVKLAVSSKLGSCGELLRDMAGSNGAILAVNASGFTDYGGIGNGGNVLGLLIKDGVKLNDYYGDNSTMIGFDRENNLRIGIYEDTTLFRDAIEFKPTLIVNGIKVVEDSAGWGLQPRTVIGQSDKGEVLLMVIDGRQVGYSLGATMEQCADVLLKHGAIQAAALDGGSSSLMVYDGEEITRTSSPAGKKGRLIPNAFIVLKSGE